MHACRSTLEDPTPDGAVGSVEHHLTGAVFVRSTNAASPVGANPGGLPTFILDAVGNPTPQPDPQGFTARRAVASFLLAYDSNMAPAVGQQITLSRSSGADARQRVALLASRSAAGDCDLVAKFVLLGEERGFARVAGPADRFRPDRSRSASLDLDGLEALVYLRGAGPLTFTCVPPGSGLRIGIDRDADGIADHDER